MNILFNFDWGAYPYTTASYFYDAAKEIKGITPVLPHEDKCKRIDFIFNIMPFEQILAFPGVPSCYYEIDNHLIQGRKTHYYQLVDKVFVAQRHFLHLYDMSKTYYLPLACDPNKHRPFLSRETDYDIGFIGNASYPDRSILLEILKCHFKVLITNTDPGYDYSWELSRCKFSFNRSMDKDVNMRFFEAIAIGKLLFSDYLPAQAELAESGKHYIAYKNAQDLVSKVKYYLSHYDEAKKIAACGSSFVRQNHTYKDRLLRVLAKFGWTKFS